MSIRSWKFSKGPITVAGEPGGNATIRTEHGVFVRRLNHDTAEAAVERADVPDLIDCLTSFSKSTASAIHCVDGVVVEWSEE